MNKVLCNKTSILIVLNFILLAIYSFLIPITYLIFESGLGVLMTTYIFIPIYLLLYVKLHHFYYKRAIKKHGIYMYIENNTIVYNEKIFIPRLMISKIVYKNINIDEKKLIFYLCDDTVEEIYLSKGLVKKIAKTFQLNIIYDKESRKKYKEEKRKQNKMEVINFIKENKYRIMFCFIGLVLTVISFILDSMIDSNIIKIIICILCISCGWCQLYFLYIIKIDKDILTRIIISTIATLLILLLMIILIIFILNDLNTEIKVTCIFYAMYLFPSFILIGIIILLIMSGM